MTRRLSPWCGVALLLAGSLSAASLWEVKGDRYMQAGMVSKALEAYETAVAGDPHNEALLAKYERAFLTAFLKGQVEGGGVGGLTRTGPARTAPPPAPPEPAPEEVPATEAVAGEEGEGEASSAGKEGEEPSTGEETPAEASGTARSDPGVAVRKDGVVEVDFRRLLGGITRMGGNIPRAPPQGKSGEVDDEEDEEDEEDPGPVVRGAAEVVELGTVRQGFEGTDGAAVEPEKVSIRSANYQIDDVVVAYDRSGNLHIKGKITNTARKVARLPRVYARIFDAAGVLRGRSFSYLSPGRNSLGSGKTKSFDIEFRGYREPVASYRFEVIP